MFKNADLGSDMISAQETDQSHLVRTEMHSYRLSDSNSYLDEASRITVPNTMNCSLTDVCRPTG